MAGGNVLREYRKGNWTVHETMILIEAKKMDQERRLKKPAAESEGKSRFSASFPTELRWKWIEDFCWSKGCLRSQNQCNDKWDNLMRDYKKVREHESRLAEKEDGVVSSYWQLERHDRKDRSLPTNMLLQIYESLVEVVESRGVQGFSGPASASIMSYVLEKPVTIPSLPPLLQHHTSDPTPPFQIPTLDSDTNEHSDSQAKRRKKGKRASTRNEELDSTISTSASIIAEALQSCEQQEEIRHREYLSL